MLRNGPACATQQSVDARTADGALLPVSLPAFPLASVERSNPRCRGGQPLDGTAPPDFQFSPGFAARASPQGSISNVAALPPIQPHAISDSLVAAEPNRLAMSEYCSPRRSRGASHGKKRAVGLSVLRAKWQVPRNPTDEAVAKCDSHGPGRSTNRGRMAVPQADMVKRKAEDRAPNPSAFDSTDSELSRGSTTSVSSRSTDSGYGSAFESPPFWPSSRTPDSLVAAVPPASKNILCETIEKAGAWTEPETSIELPSRPKPLPSNHDRSESVSGIGHTTTASDGSSTTCISQPTPNGDFSCGHRGVNASTHSSKNTADATTMDIEPECDAAMAPGSEEAGQSAESGLSYAEDLEGGRLADAEPNETDGLETEDEDMDAQELSRSPTPWPESWYEGGSELGLERFAGSILEACFRRRAEAYGDDASTTQCPMDGDTGRRDPPTSGAWSTTGQASHSGAPGSGNCPAKRPRSGGSGDDDGGEDSRSPKRRDVMGPPGKDISCKKSYACPYQKRFPGESPLCGRPHGSKTEFGWDSVSRVKLVPSSPLPGLLTRPADRAPDHRQHLLESHGIDHHCPNCWKAYKKVDDAKRCQETRKCIKRQSPPKLWLSASETAQLKAERVANQSDNAWYRIFGILFPDIPEHGPDGYRAKYTPCKPSQRLSVHSRHY
jgi:hypothetical protein